MTRMSDERLAELSRALPGAKRYSGYFNELLAALKAERQETICVVCGGSPNPSGIKCICDDTGLLSVAEFNARSELLTLRQRVVELESERARLYDVLDCTDPAKDTSEAIDLIAVAIDKAVQYVEEKGESSNMYRLTLKCLHHQRRYKGELFEKHTLAERAKAAEARLEAVRG